MSPTARIPPTSSPQTTASFASRASLSAISAPTKIFRFQVARRMEVSDRNRQQRNFPFRSVARQNLAERRRMPAHEGARGRFCFARRFRRRRVRNSRGKQRPQFPVVKRYGESNENPAGEWNNADIICIDGTITVFINGTLQNRATKAANKSATLPCSRRAGKSISAT